MDLCQRFGMDPSCWDKYIQGELLRKQELIDVVNYRHSKEDLWETFPQGLPGTVLNGFCLYALIRHFGVKNAVETGVANGFYTSFMLAAIIENEGQLHSVDICDHEDIAMCVPEKYRTYPGWHLTKGVDSLAFLKDKTPHEYDLCVHDSLHTRDHMSKEFEIFKNTNKEQFLIFVDDQNSQDWFEFMMNLNEQSKNGYTFRVAEGRFCQIKGHLGGFFKYQKKA